MLVYRLFREVTLHSSGPEHSTTCDSRINLNYIIYIYVCFGSFVFYGVITPDVHIGATDQCGSLSYTLLCGWYRLY